MKENTKAMVLASFAADALALGAHWIYDISVIKEKIGRVTVYHAPLADSFHQGKQKGDFTHYGDQMLVLLRSMASGKGFSLDAFARQWRDSFDDYTGYRDHATGQTLKNFNAGLAPDRAGSRSTDLGGASRMAPLGHVYCDDPAAFMDAAKSQTAMTHNVPQVIDAAAFFAMVTTGVMAGQDPVAAITKAGSGDFDRPPFNEWVRAGLESASRETTAAIADFGQMCRVDGAFPSVIHLIARYPDDLRSALVENVMAGGDSAARGMLAGMVIGAHCGMTAIPEPWITDMGARDEIEDLLSR